MSHMLKISVAVIVTVIIAWAGTYIFLNHEKNQKMNSIKQINSDSLLCTAEPEGTDMGSDIYPIDKKYGNVKFLGQLFTAESCGPERVSKLFGVNGENYVIGSSIHLKNKPDQLFINTLKSIGYACRFKIAESSCKDWQLWKAVKIRSLMQLEIFHENIEYDDCTKCG